jgi:PKD repeat protein
LIAENQCPRDTQTISLLVMPNDIDAHVSINGNQLEGCAPHSVTFNNSSTGASQLTWDFGDESQKITTPNTQNTVTYTFLTGGEYTISIKLENECTDTVIYRRITVYNKPHAGFDINNPVICTGNNVITTSTAQYATACEWLWGDGQTSSSANETHAYPSAGT